MISLNKLSKNFSESLFEKKVVLNELTYSFPEKGIHFLIGSNGAGKTTLLKIILGLLKQSGGKVFFHPSLGKTKREIRGRIGHFPERPYLPQYMRGNEFLQLVLKMNNLGGKSHKEIKNLSDRLDISHALSLPISNYSKGMRQRLGLVAALLKEPKALILDEPFSGLDPLGRELVFEFLWEERKKGVFILSTAHYLSDLRGLSDQIVLLKNGKIHSAWEKDEFWTQGKEKKIYDILFNLKEINNDLSQHFLSLEKNVDAPWRGKISSQEKNVVMEKLVKSGAEIEKIELGQKFYSEFYLD